jgi:ABC-2 type transport system permease protein
MNLLILSEYKIDFLSINLASILILIIGVINIKIIFSQINSLQGWNMYQILWILGFYYLIRAVYNTFFINTLNIGYWIRNGMLDIYILRPLGTFFQLISTGRYNAELPFDEYIAGIGLLVISQDKIHIINSSKDIILCLILFIISEIIYFNIFCITSMISFWSLKSNGFNELIRNIERLIEYPLDIYGKGIRLFMSIVIPFAFVSYYPSLVFLKNTNWEFVLIISLIIAIFLISINRILWMRGMKTYQSTGA